MKREINLTNGVILDPYSIHATGVLRAHAGLKKIDPSATPIYPVDMFGPLHGEARFKQAFVNCCHFAEQMTVVGPVAQMVWDKGRDSSIGAALRWLARADVGENEEFFQHVIKYCEVRRWGKVPVGAYKDGSDFLLNVMPDVGFKFPSVHNQDSEWGVSSDAHKKLMQLLYKKNYGARSQRRCTERSIAGGAEPIYPGMPVAALMAVTFSFKKPGGPTAAAELTNLGGWPPVTFLLPVMVPAGTTIRKHEEDMYYSDPLEQTIFRQPSVYSYRLSLTRGNRIIPFGQPFDLTSIPGHGKTPDNLRALSDVFKALWSQATQYSAWNVSLQCDTSMGEDDRKIAQWMNPKHTAKLDLDPIGAGRRIRGHNRYTGKFDFDNVAMVWEEGRDDPDKHKIFGLDLPNASKSCTQFQLRQQHRGGKNPYENIFIMPSYFTEGTTLNLFPVAVSLLRYNTVDDATIADFLTGRFLPSVEPIDVRKEDSAHGPRTASFVDNVAAWFGKDDNNRGALPVHRIGAEIGFDPTGDPRVFGLAANQEVMDVLEKKDHDEDDVEKIVKETHTLGSFKFLDAICAKNTKDLTGVFGAIKKSGITAEAGTKASDMLDRELAIDLFGGDLDGMFS